MLVRQQSLAKNSSLRLSDISEFKDALKSYTNVISKAKSIQSLKNYQQKFRKHIKEKVIKSNDKLCNKISKIIEPGLMTISNFQVFPLLLSIGLTKIPLRIPDTLYYDGNNWFLIRTRKILEIISGVKSCELFLAEIQENLNSPFCLFKPEDGKISLFDSLSGLKHFMVQHSKVVGYYQHFIQHGSSNASILFAYAKKGSYIRTFIIQNNEEISQRPSKVLESRQSGTSNNSAFQMVSACLKNIVFKHNSIKTLKRQSTFQFPESSDSSLTVLEEPSYEKDKESAKYTNLIQRIRASGNFLHPNEYPSNFENSDNMRNYIVKLRNTRNLTVYQVKTVIPAIEKMSKYLFIIISNHFKKTLSQEISEISLVFIKHCTLGWYFLKVKDLKLSQKPTVEKTEIESPDTIIELSYHFSSSISDMSKASDSISLLPNPEITRNDELKNDKQIKVRSICNIQAKSFLNHHKAKSVNFNLSETANNYISEAALNYDSFKINARMAKADFQSFESKYNASGIWKELSIKVQKNIMNSAIARYFFRFSSEKYYSLSEGIQKVFCSNFDTRYKKYIKDVHKGFKITHREFDILKNIYFRNIRDYNIEEKDLEIIDINFEMFRNCVVQEN
ncbi:hypothetical protein SteCoe_29642 [Stentor coeruleus]|uniref:Uncharacterized protein n=1 Tax=Stentor coeruleus TaxID=5963 RepID=A0A1R2B5J3_9CILI|nr:hypothetical protein SteCoe_29642 [Stentor coeruleus]